MVLMTDAGPITDPVPIDDLIISGELEEALDRWSALRAGCSCPENVWRIKADIRMRIEYKLQCQAGKLGKGVEAVKENLLAFLRAA